jgi:hypothetical protein
MKNGVFWVVTPCEEPHGVTTQKTPFFVVTAAKTSNLTHYNFTFTMNMFYSETIGIPY